MDPVLSMFLTCSYLFPEALAPSAIGSFHPFSTLVEELGPIGNIEVETSTLLKDRKFLTEEFSENVLKCLPPPSGISAIFGSNLLF